MRRRDKPLDLFKKLQIFRSVEEILEEKEATYKPSILTGYEAGLSNAQAVSKPLSPSPFPLLLSPSYTLGIVRLEEEN